MMYIAWLYQYHKLNLVIAWCINDFLVGPDINTILLTGFGKEAFYIVEIR